MKNWKSTDWAIAVVFVLWAVLVSAIVYSSL